MMASVIDIAQCISQADTSHTIAAAGLCGFLFHLAILAPTFEFELIMYHFFASYLVALFTYMFALIQTGNRTPIQAAARGSLVTASFSMAVFTSMSIYRVFFHRCRKFPGPFPAKLTRFYTSYLVAKNLEYYKEIEKMHAKYGDFVRTGNH